MAGWQTDITEGKVSDPLTGLPNRLYLLTEWDALSNIRNGARVSVCGFILDLDVSR